ncbi:aminotransferase, partial [Pseudomonas aeruginosa]
MSPLELFAASLGAIAVYLTVRQNPWCWPIGLVMVALYAWIFFEVKLYSDMLLQMVYAALQLYGWWQWTRGGQDHDGRSVSRLNAAQRLYGLGAGLVGSVALGYLMANHT